jgi:CRP-like cAMP-binding protein
MHHIQEVIDQINHEGQWEREIILDRNELLHYTACVDSNLYWVEDGTLRLYVIAGDEEQIIRFAYKHNLFALLDSYITGKPTQFQVQSLRKTTLKSMSKVRFLALLQSLPSGHSLWQSMLEQLVLQQMERELDVLTPSPTERYQRVLKRSPQLFQEIPHKYIANYLRMTPETLSRLKSKS